MKTRKFSIKNVRGFSLVELLITLVVFAIVAAGIYNIYIYMHRTWLAENSKAEMQQRARVAFDTMVKDLMSMGYGSGQEHKICISLEHELEYYRYLKAGESWAPSEAEYLIDYKLDGNVLKKYLIQGATIVKELALADHVSSIKFEYRDANNSVMSPPYPTDDAGHDKIRRIILTLVLDPAKTVPGTVQNKITLTADITPRNLVEGEIANDGVAPTAPAGGWNLRVIDTQNCGSLKAKWNKATDNYAIAGYMIGYGLSVGTYNYRQIPIESIADPDNPSAEFSVDYSPYYGGSANSYYVVVYAYDRNLNRTPDSTPVSPDGGAYPNITSFSQGGNDTTNNVKRPVAPTGFAATSQPDAVRLTWGMPSDPNVVGYRIYRSYSTFSPGDFPISDTQSDHPNIKQLTKETESSDGWAGGPNTRTDRTTLEYTDDDTNLIGCKVYHYAICSVTCDRSRIMGDAGNPTWHGGRYTSAQYAETTGSPDDTTPPSSPSISSRAGWQRVFLNVPQWPPNSDYAYTVILFSKGASYPPAYDPDHPDAILPYLISDRESGQSKGTFITKGSSSDHDIIFNYASTGIDDNNDPVDTAEPTLENSQTYRFRAVAFDNCGNASSSAIGEATTWASLCGDDPCGPPTWNVPVSNRYVWVDASNSNLDASSWTSEAQIRIGLKWTAIDTTDPDTGLDFWGYYVDRNTSPNLTNSYSVGSCAWNNYIESAGLREGGRYYYGIRAADCVYKNMKASDPDIVAMCNGVSTTESYSYIQVHNRTADADTLWSCGMKPGRFALYARTDTDSTYPQYRAVSTSGEYHNIVNLYLENTSLANLNLDKMILTWGNASAYLKTIKIYNNGSWTTYQANNASSSSQYQVSINMSAINCAYGIGAPSDAIPVVLEFVDITGNASDVADMRNDLMKMEISFTNPSMPDGPGSSTGVSGFTTGSITGANPITFRVGGGPSINYVTQNQPLSPTNPLQVDNADTATSPPASTSSPKVNGVDTIVTANITKPLNETITSVRLYYAYADLSAANPPNTSTFIPVDMTAVGGSYTGTIPGANTAYQQKGVWYYIVVNTNWGNSTRAPYRTTSYYYFQLLTFNACSEKLMAPTGLTGSVSGSNAALSWYATTKYVTGSGINPGDSVKYNVYRRIGLVGDFPTSWACLNAASQSSISFTDSNYGTASSGGTQPVSYLVTAVNGCTAMNESSPSNMYIVCPSAGSGCAIMASSEVYAGDNITLNIVICSSANNGASSEAGLMNFAGGPETESFNVWETSDTGTASRGIETTMNPADTANKLLVIPQGSNSETITVTPVGADSAHTLFSGGCSESATVHVWVKPCDNTPAAPTGVAYNFSASGTMNLSWDAVDLNTDGSPATYAPTYTPTTITGDRIVNYEVWYLVLSNGVIYSDPNASLNNWNKVNWNGTGTSVPIAGIKKNTNYYFAVRAIDTCGNGQFTTFPVTRP